MTLNDNAIKACRTNNNEVIGKCESQPTKGGNADKFKSLNENQGNVLVEEVTMDNWQHAAV